MSNHLKRILFVVLFFLVAQYAICGDLWASQGEGSSNIMHRVNLLIFQISFIIIATWTGGSFFEKMRLPGVLGEIVAGVIIGPYALGGLPLVGFEHGVFPVFPDFPVSVELYSLATVASIILLFFAGLETDLRTFLKYSINGTIIGISGVIFSFVAGDILGILLSKTMLGTTQGFFDPIPLFLGVISTATSVGISARILSEKRKINTPEGVTILSAAVIDDVLGIIILAIIMGMVQKQEITALQITWITVKALSMWLGFTVLGLIYASHITGMLKKIKDRGKIAMLSFAMALLLAGIFERSGLAMIIGAYIAGLSLSKTDLSFVIQETLEGLHKFLVPIFFCVMGMLINLNEVFAGPILKISLLYIIFAVISKVAGCFIPAMFLGFNWRGGLRIGMGMVPRGEVALIIAGIGLASGFVSDEIFTVAVIMTFVTTLITPPILDKLFDSSQSGLTKPGEEDHQVRCISFHMPSEQTADLIREKVVEAFENEGYFVYRMDLPERIYHIRKDSSFITFHYSPQIIRFDCSDEDETFIHTLFFEVIAEFEYFISNLKSISDKESIARKMLDTPKPKNVSSKVISTVLSPNAVEHHLRSEDKKGIIKELIQLLLRSGQITIDQYEKVFKDVLTREDTMSTGLQDGVAFPHAKTAEVSQLMVAVGLKKEGVDFKSLDGKPSRIFILTLAPKSDPKHYLKFMAEVSQSLTTAEYRDKIFKAKDNMVLYNLLVANGHLR